jgi:hypothetical protein
VVSTRPEGTPQGGPLSPLLFNILQPGLDRELKRRGHRFRRYANDCDIYVRSSLAKQRVIDVDNGVSETKAEAEGQGSALVCFLRCRKRNCISNAEGRRECPASYSTDYQHSLLPNRDLSGANHGLLSQPQNTQTQWAAPAAAVV